MMMVRQGKQGYHISLQSWWARRESTESKKNYNTKDRENLFSTCSTELKSDSIDVY